MTESGYKRFRYIQFKGGDPYRRYVDSKMNEDVLAREQRNDVLDDLVHGSYGALLLHPLWKQKRSEILLRDKNCCVICNRSDMLQVHHRQYHFVIEKSQFKLPWEYADHLLITLCESCHKRGHSKYKVPIIKV